jgi:hypothetical protein
VVINRHGRGEHTICLGGGDLGTIDDLFAVFYVHAMTAFDFLSRES